MAKNINGRLNYGISLDNSTLRASAEESKRILQGIGSTARAEGENVDAAMRKIGTAIGGVFAADKLKDFGKQIAVVRGEFQQLEIAFSTMLGSKQKADELMAQLINTAVITPFNMRDVAGSAKQLLAYGLAADEVNDTLIRLGDIAAGLSIPINDLAYLYGTTMVQGRMYTQDLNQFLNRGIPLTAELAKQFGVTESKVRTLVEEGKVGFPKVKKAIESLTNEGAKFGGLLEAQSQSISGQIADIEDAIEQMFNEIGKSSEGFISDALSGVGTLVENYERVGTILLGLVSAMGAYKAALIAVTAIENAKQTFTANTELDLLNQEIEATSRLLPLQEQSKNADLEAAVASGQLTQSLADQIAARREVLEQLSEQVDARKAELLTELAIGKEQLDAVNERLDIADAAHIKSIEELNSAQRAKDIADQKVKAAQEYLEAQKEIAAYQEDILDYDEEGYAQLQAAIAEQKAAAKNLETASERENAAAIALNTVEQEANTIAQKVNTTQTQLDTMVERGNTAATQVNTAAQVANTSATTSNTFAQRLNAIQTKVAATAQAVFAAAVNSVKNAWNSMKVAMMTNPIGSIISVATIAISVFYSLADAQDEAADSAEKYGEAADVATAKVNTLYATIESQTLQTTKVQTDAMDELKKLAEEYGIKLKEEEGLYQQLIEKKKELIGLIREESIERQRANDLAGASTKYQTDVDDAKKKIKDKLEDTLSSFESSQLINLFDPQKLAEYYKVWDKFVSYGTEISKSQRAEYEKTKAQLKAYQADIEKVASSYTKSLGKNEGQISKVNGVLRQLLPSLGKARVAYEEAAIGTDRAAAAAANAAKAADGMSESQRKLADRNRMAKMTMEELDRHIGGVIDKYNKANINIQISYEEINDPPKWMEEQAKGLTSDELKNRAAYYLAEHNRQRDHRERTGRELVITSKDGRALNEHDTLKLSGQYSNVGESKYEEEEKARREREANEKEAKRKAEQEAKKVAQEAKQIADQTADRLKAIEKYKSDVIEANKKAQLDIERQQLENLQDGFEKESKIIDLNYRRLVAENAEREREMLEALADNRLREWLNKNPRASKQQQLDYRSSLLDPKSANRITADSLTPEQKQQLEAYAKIAVDIQEKAHRDLYKRVFEQYQDFETRRAAVAKKYAEERAALEGITIEKAQEHIEGWAEMNPAEQANKWSAYQKQIQSSLKVLSEREKQELKSINEEQVDSLQKTSTILVDIFADAADKSTEEIRRIYKQSKELIDYLRNTKSDDIKGGYGFTAEQLRAIQSSPDKMKALVDRITALGETLRKGNPFKTLADDIKALFISGIDETKRLPIEAKLKRLGASAAEAAKVVSDMAGKLSEMFEASGNENLAEAFAGLQQSMESIGNIAQGFAQGGVFGGVQAIIGEGVGLLTKAFQANARHKEALREILRESTAQQREYNLALLEEKLIAEDLNTVFGSFDYSKLKNATGILLDANRQLNEMLNGGGKVNLSGLSKKFYDNDEWRKLESYAGLTNLQIKTGHEKTGWFGLGKGKDTYSSLLEIYPELIDQAGNLNLELAKTIVSTRTFNGEGKEALENIIALAEQVEKGNTQVKDYLTSIFGKLGNTLSSAMTDAFRNGTDAAKTFVDDVASMLEKLGEQMIYSAVFSEVFKQAEKQMIAITNATNQTDEQKFNAYTATLSSFVDNVTSQIQMAQDLYKSYQDMAAAKGFNVFKPADAERQATAKGIAQASQDSIDELNGRATAIQSHTFSISENTQLLVSVTNAILKSVMGIERNTEDVPTRLAQLESNTKALKDTINDIAIKGIKIK